MGRLSLRTTRWLGWIVVAIMVCATLVARASESSDGSDPPTSRPNVILLLADDERADTIGAWGNPHIETPQLDRLARSGLSFRNNYCFGGNNGAVCVPSRAMLHSGRYWFHVHNDLSDARLLGEHLAAHGYKTFATGKWHNGERSFARAFQTGRNVFFGGMSDHTQVPVRDWHAGQYGPVRIDARFSSDMFADTAIEFLKQHPTDQPFFAYVAFTAPHDPRQPPEPFRSQYYARRPPLPQNFLTELPYSNGIMDDVRDEQLAAWPRDPETIRDQLAEYYGMISHLDTQIGRILDALAASPHARTTYVIFAADQGLSLGGHGLLGKQNIYEDSMRSPLIIVGPGIPADQSTYAFTYLLDLYPTVCHLTKTSLPEGLDGQSLHRLWQASPESIRSSIFLPFLNLSRAVRDDEWKLIRHLSIDHSELYHLRDDPTECVNLMDDPQHAIHRDRLQQLLVDWQRASGDPVALPPSVPHEQAQAIDRSRRLRVPDPWQPRWIVEKYFPSTSKP